MNFFQIETFLTIVNTKSLSRAAELLFVTQPTVSQRLKALEDEMGIVMLDRRKGLRAIELTPKGEQFVPIAMRWMEVWQEILLLKASNEKLPLSLGCEGDLQAFLLAPLFQKIAGDQENTLFDLSVSAASAAEIYQKVASGALDIGLSFESLNMKNVLVEPVFSEPHYILRMPVSGEPRRTAYHPSELDSRDELQFDCSPGYRLWHDRWFASSQNPREKIVDPSSLPAHTTRPEDWSVVPASLVRAFTSFSQVTGYEILSPPPPRICYLVTQKTPRESRIKSIQLFNDFLMQYIGSLDYLE